MMRPIVLIVCNALDDKTRQSREITTDSPAASRKVFQLSQALKQSGVRPIILSLGRGRTNGKRDYFPRTVKRVNGIPIVYGPFSNIPFVSEVLSLFAFIAILIRFSTRPKKAVIYYNRMPAYILTLLTSTITGYNNFIDIEDGEIFQKSNKYYLNPKHFIIALYERFCNKGALLACQALQNVTKVRPTLCFYGTVNSTPYIKRTIEEDLHILMAGTIEPETGSDILISSIKKMRSNQDAWTKHIYIDVTGKGSAIKSLENMAAEPGWPRVVVHGRLTDKEYKKVLRNSHIGLSLKRIEGILADTTFPSKVVEFANEGLLVIATDISDVRKLMGNGAYYLTKNDPDQLISLLKQANSNRTQLTDYAKQGHITIANFCSKTSTGARIANFLFGTNVK